MYTKTITATEYLELKDPKGWEHRDDTKGPSFEHYKNSGFDVHEYLWRTYGADFMNILALSGFLWSPDIARVMNRLANEFLAKEGE